MRRSQLKRKTPLRAARQRKCKVCGDWFRPRSTTQRVCPNLSCAIEFARQVKEREDRRERRQRREQMKTLGQLCAETQRHVNKFVRVRDAERSCICCSDGAAEDAGHFFPIGQKYRVSRIRFDARVIHGCCAKCNRFIGGGNIHGYIAGIESRYGSAELKSLYLIKADADRPQPKLTKAHVRLIGQAYRRLTKELIRCRNGGGQLSDLKDYTKSAIAVVYGDLPG